jgi:hypothetical protein
MAAFDYSNANFVLLAYKHLCFIVALAMVFLLNMDPGRTSIISDVMRQVSKANPAKI